MVESPVPGEAAPRTRARSGLLGLIALCVVVAIATFTQRASRESLRTLSDDVSLLSTCAQAMGQELRPTLWELRQTVEATAECVSPYDMVHFPGASAAPLRGAAARSETVLGLSWNGAPQLAWVLRDLNMAWGPLLNRPFVEMTLHETRWAGLLLRLTRDEAQSLDASLDSAWVAYELPAASRGENQAFEHFEVAAEQAAVLSRLRSLSHDAYEGVFERLVVFIHQAGIDTKSDEGEVSMGTIVATMKGSAAAMTVLRLPFVDLAVPHLALSIMYLVAAPLLTYYVLTTWREGQDPGRPGALSASWLFSLRTTNRAVDLVALLVIGLAIGLALLAVGWTSYLERSWLIPAGTIVSAAAVAWSARLRLFSRVENTTEPVPEEQPTGLDEAARAPEAKPVPSPPPPSRGNRLWPEESVKFFEDRIADAFAGARGLVELRDSEQAIERLEILLRTPLRVAREYPIWQLLVQGSLAIESFGIQGPQLVLVGRYRYRVAGLTAWRSERFGHSFVLLQWDADEPTGLYSGKTQEEIDAIVEQVGDCREEYGVEGSDLFTRAELDDRAAVRSRRLRRLADARLEVRHLASGFALIAAQFSSVHHPDFDRERADWIRDLRQKPARIHALARRVEELPNHHDPFPPGMGM